jgi:hypothetical protein
MTALPAGWRPHSTYTNAWEYAPDGIVLGWYSNADYCDPPVSAHKGGVDRLFDWPRRARAWIESTE